VNVQLTVFRIAPVLGFAGFPIHPLKSGTEKPGETERTKHGGGDSENGFARITACIRSGIVNESSGGFRDCTGLGKSVWVETKNILPPENPAELGGQMSKEQYRLDRLASLHHRIGQLHDLLSAIIRPGATEPEVSLDMETLPEQIRDVRVAMERDFDPFSHAFISGDHDASNPTEPKYITQPRQKKAMAEFHVRSAAASPHTRTMMRAMMDKAGGKVDGDDLNASAIGDIEPLRPDQHAELAWRKSVAANRKLAATTMNDATNAMAATMALAATGKSN